MKRCLLLAIAGLAMGFALSAFAQEQKAVDPEVRQRIEVVMMKFVEAYNNRDVASISPLHTQDAVEVRAAGVVLVLVRFPGDKPSRKCLQPTLHQILQSSSASLFRCMR